MNQVTRSSPSKGSTPSGSRSETRRKVTIDDIGRLSMVVWAFYYFFPQFASNVLLEMHGVSFAYTGFYWLANGFMFAIILLVAWKYHHPLAQMALIPVFIYVGYASTRLFIDEYIDLNPGIVIFSGVVTALAILNLVLVIKNMVRAFARKKWLPKMRALKSSKVFKIAALGSLAWFGMVSWSYIGFSQTYTVVDPGHANFSFAFWGSPSAGTNISHYSTPEGIAEMQRYQQLNASFYNTINMNTLSNNATLAIYEAMLNEWEPYNVSIIYDLPPLYWNGTNWDFPTQEPWTFIGREGTHPNDEQSGGIHWSVRRWTATEVTGLQPLAIRWHVRKTNTNGTGVTGAVHINGMQADMLQIPGNDSTGRTAVSVRMAWHQTLDRPGRMTFAAVADGYPAAAVTDRRDHPRCPLYEELGLLGPVI